MASTYFRFWVNQNSVNPIRSIVSEASAKVIRYTDNYGYRNNDSIQVKLKEGKQRIFFINPLPFLLTRYNSNSHCSIKSKFSLISVHLSKVVANEVHTLLPPPRRSGNARLTEHRFARASPNRQTNSPSNGDV